MHATPEMQDMHRKTMRSHERISPMIDFGFVGGLAPYDLKSSEMPKFVSGNLRDSFIMETAYSVCKQYGIPIGEAPKVDLINLAYGRDFLLTADKYDVVIGGFVFYKQNEAFPEPFGNADKKFFMQSNHAANPEDWQQRILNSGASLVLNVTKNETELPTSHLLAPGFQKIATRPFFAPSSVNRNVYDMDILMRDDLREALNIPHPKLAA